jgi:hypothetical protein
VDSLLLYGVAYWRVTSLYEDDGRPSGFEWVANTRVTVTTDQYGDEVDYYAINGVRVPDSGVGIFSNFSEFITRRIRNRRAHNTGSVRYTKSG